MLLNVSILKKFNRTKQNFVKQFLCSTMETSDKMPEWKMPLKDGKKTNWTCYE